MILVLVFQNSQRGSKSFSKKNIRKLGPKTPGSERLHPRVGRAGEPWEVESEKDLVVRGISRSTEHSETDGDSLETPRLLHLTTNFPVPDLNMALDYTCANAKHGGLVSGSVLDLVRSRP